jgi:predicted deacetylase
MRVHVSIHDVSPAWALEVEDALALAKTHGIRPALLVVPNFHGEAPLLEATAYCARLRALQAEGHEIYLHGFYHRADAEKPSARAFFRQRVVSAGEAEFASIDAREAERRLDEGTRVLTEAGLRIDGFVAPAWSFAPSLLGALGDRGIRYTEDHLTVYDPVERTRRRSLVLNFASRSLPRMASTVAFCRVATVGARLFPTRFAIHPGDMRHRILRSETERLLAWSAPRLAKTGAELFAS